MKEILKNICIFIVCLSIIFFAYLENYKGMSGLLLMLIILVFYFNVEKIDYFKGAGIEAKLKSTLNEANSLIVELRELALSLTEPIIVSMTMGNNPFDGFIKKKDKIIMKNKIVESLEKLQIDKSKIDEAVSFLNRKNLMDHLNHIRFHIRNEDRDQFDNILRNIIDFNSYYKRKDEMLDFIKAKGYFNDIEENLLDLDYFIEKGEIRRDEIFQG